MTATVHIEPRFEDVDSHIKETYAPTTHDVYRVLKEEQERVPVHNPLPVSDIANLADCSTSSVRRAIDNLENILVFRKYHETAASHELKVKLLGCQFQIRVVG